MATKAKAPSHNGTEESYAPVQLERLSFQTAEIEIEGLTPYIPHAWSEKARRMMLDKQQGKAKQKLPPKNPEQEAYDATYWIEEGLVGCPATAFKAAIADAARFFDKSVTIEMLKRVIFIKGIGEEQLVPIEGERLLFEAMPRNSGGTADLRYRYKVWPWKATLEVEFMRSLLTPEALVTLVDAAGRNGVGDWRPSSPKSKTGTYGMFTVK